MTILRISWVECQYILNRRFGTKNLILKNRKGCTMKEPVYLEGERDDQEKAKRHRKTG